MPIVDTSHSAYARLRPVSIASVHLEDDFWFPRLQQNQKVSLPSQYRLLEETGRIDNFRRISSKLPVSFQGYYFNDSDVYKWLEAVAWSQASNLDPRLDEMADTVIAAVGAAQSADGYLDTYFGIERSSERWKNLRDLHELYCAGHLIQAGIAYRRSTGRQDLFEIAVRLAEHLVHTFGPSGRPGTPGHPEVEMALVELSRETGDLRYRGLAQSFLDQRGQNLIGGRAYHLDRLPFRQLEKLEGHAVRALYLCCGAADLAAESGEAYLRATLERLWQHMTARQIYITGGVGARHDGEAFGEDFELPNQQAYTETCAAIANMMWCWRMLQLDGQAAYTDLFERVLYNGFLSGISLDGLAYFYVNPLADDGQQRRKPWFACACCPPNVARFLAQLPGYFYSLSDEGAWVHLYASGRAELNLLDGQMLALRQKADYPWGGRIRIEIEGQSLRKETSLFLRIPSWLGDQPATLKLNGSLQDLRLVPGSYVELRRLWQPGDILDLDLALEARFLQSHPFVVENLGRVALQRGPLLYCFEGDDQPHIDLRQAAIQVSKPVEMKSCNLEVAAPGAISRIVQLQLSGAYFPLQAGWEQHLYQPWDSINSSETPSPKALVAIPYFAWANRMPGQLQVWMRSM